MDKLWHVDIKNNKAIDNLIQEYVSKLESNMYNRYVDGCCTSLLMFSMPSLRAPQCSGWYGEKHWQNGYKRGH